MLFIEGVGGIMVPLDARHTVLDWMAALDIPLLLVVGSYLGTISHTLTALDVLAQRNLKIAAIVVSESERGTVALDDTVASIARFSDGGRGDRPAAAAGRAHPASGLRADRRAVVQQRSAQPSSASRRFRSCLRG